MAGPAIASTELPFPRVRRGKVRDVYDVGEGRLLIVATDRISAFDVVLPQPIPGKGEVLTRITAWWLERLADLGPHHLISADAERIEREVPSLAESRAQWEGRGMLCRATKPLPVECVVRGYLSGSAWKEYRAAGTLAGEPLPRGLRESERLEPPIFSPATKAVGGHDENIPFAEVERRIGSELARELRRRSLEIYERGRELAGRSGIIVADTKLEFGRVRSGGTLLIDEVLTPDSSRFWPASDYAPGRAQTSFDKQPVRDWLEERARRGEWEMRPPAPELPMEVVDATAARYRDLYRRLTGEGSRQEGEAHQ